MNKRLGFDNRGETSRAIEKMRREHPEWPSSEIARTASWWPVHDEHSNDKSEHLEGVDL
jgi:hypothetical protein